jgi:DNA-directed RNA polymerase subunit RPC12/RpoP
MKAIKCVECGTELTDFTERQTKNGKTARYYPCTMCEYGRDVTVPADNKED